MAQVPANEEDDHQVLSDVEYNDQAEFGRSIRRKLKLEAHVTSGCGKNKDKLKVVEVFYGKVWPRLEGLGWTKVEGTGRRLGAVKFVCAGGNVNGIRDLDYFDRIRDLLDHLLERKSPELVEVADLYERELRRLTEGQGKKEKVTSTTTPQSRQKESSPEPASKTKKQQKRKAMADAGTASITPVTASKKLFEMPSQLKETMSPQPTPIAPTPGKRKRGRQPSPRGRKNMRVVVAGPQGHDLSWKEGGRNFPKRSSMVGPDHQVTEIPQAGSYADQPDGSEVYCELLWDPIEAAKKGVIKLPGTKTLMDVKEKPNSEPVLVQEPSVTEDDANKESSTAGAVKVEEMEVDGNVGVEVDANDKFIEEIPYNKKEAALLLLAKRGYDLHEFQEVVDSIQPTDGSDWPRELKDLYHAEIFRLRKNFNALSKSLETLQQNQKGQQERTYQQPIPMKTIITYYLSSFKKSNDYRLLKTVCREAIVEKERSSEYGLDACAICADGGTLLVCDHCEGEYHMACMKPPLKAVPEGHWECDECVDSKLLAARAFLIQNCKLFVQNEKSMKQEDDSDNDDVKQKSKRVKLETGSGALETSDDPTVGHETNDRQAMDVDDISSFRPTEQVLSAVRKMAEALCTALSKPAS